MPYVAANGLNMYYEVQGEGSPLLLLHGGGGSIPEKLTFFKGHLCTPGRSNDPSFCSRC
jgi:hypothetical protein